MEKDLIDRRMEQMVEEGVTFRTSVNVGVDISGQQLRSQFHAVVLAGGATQARDLPIEGRNLKGVHLAMEFLTQSNKVVAGDSVPEQITATGKNVIILGGGDTGSDCLGTSHRQGAKHVFQYELLPEPPEQENKPLTWPLWPLKLRTSSSHEEGAERDFAVLTQEFLGKHGRVTELRCGRCDDKFQPIPGTEFDLKAELVLLAMGFVSPVHEGMVTDLAVDLDPRGNVKADTQSYQTSLPKVFACGDMRRGQSLVVWAIREGRQTAHAIDKFLMGTTTLPR
jgi:glutamate synthase (NADPH) small chain